jgi:hypothetical protein
MLELLAEPIGGTAIELFVEQHHGPKRYPQRTFRDHARRGRRCHDAGNLRALACLLLTATLDASKMRLDLHCNNGGFFGPGKRCERLTAGRAA